VATPDRLLVSKLCGTAERCARERGSIAAAVDKLQQLGGGRPDLLAEAAGVTAGAWSTRLDTELGTTPLAIGLLILAGADLTELPQWFDVGQARASIPMHGAP